MIQPVARTSKGNKTRISRAAKVRKSWQLQEAKAKFSHVFDLAITTGPQRVTRREKDAVIVLSEKEYDKLRGVKRGPSLVEALMACPFPFDIPERDKNDTVGFGDRPVFE